MINHNTWKAYLSEATETPSKWREMYKNAIRDSEFWTYPNEEEDLDIFDESDPNKLSTPAGVRLENYLNNASSAYNIELKFVITVNSTGLYALGPNTDIMQGYPSVWVNYGQYEYNTEQGYGHVIFLDLRPLDDDYDFAALDISELIKSTSRVINHELVHYIQFLKQAKNKNLDHAAAWEELKRDPRQLTTSKVRGDYMSLHNEIDAFAYQAAEELLDLYDPDIVLDMIRSKSSTLFGVVEDYLNNLANRPKDLNKFWKKLYTQIQQQSIK